MQRATAYDLGRNSETLNCSAQAQIFYQIGRCIFQTPNCDHVQIQNCTGQHPAQRLGVYIRASQAPGAELQISSTPIEQDSESSQRSVTFNRTHHYGRGRPAEQGPNPSCQLMPM